MSVSNAKSDDLRTTKSSSFKLTTYLKPTQSKKNHLKIEKRPA